MGLWLLCGATSWGAPDYHQVRRDLIETMRQHEILYRACLSNLHHYRTPGYRALDIVGSCGQRLRRVVSQGQLQETRSPYDIAIEGEGYFLLSDGQMTRGGAFQLDRQGRLRSSAGSFLLGQDPVPLQIPAEVSDLEIRGDGHVFGTRLKGDGKPERLGQIGLGQVDDGAWLAGDGALFQPTSESGPLQPGVPGQQGLGVLAQGYLEYSNVNPLQQVKIVGVLSNYARLLGMPMSDLYLP